MERTRIRISELLPQQSVEAMMCLRRQKELRDRLLNWRAQQAHLRTMVRQVISDPKKWNSRFCSIAEPQWQFSLPTGAIVTLTIKEKPRFEVQMTCRNGVSLQTTGRVDGIRGKVYFRERVPDAMLMARKILEEMSRELSNDSEAYSPGKG